MTYLFPLSNRFDNFNRFPLFVSATASNLENSKSFQELLELIGQKKDFQVISCSGQEEIPWQKINFLKLEISQQDRVGGLDVNQCQV